MLRSLVTVAYRQFVRDRLGAVFTLGGLVAGLAGFAVLYAYAAHQLAFDRFHARADDLYRVTTRVQQGAAEARWAITNAALAPLTVAQVPEVEAATYLQSIQGNLVFDLGERRVTLPERTGFWAESSLFTLFDFPLRGGGGDVLGAPNRIVLTAPTARRLFGTEDAVGRTVRIAAFSEDPFVVSAVTAPLPKTSHLQFDYLLSWATNPAREHYLDPQRGGFPCYVYLLARPGTTPTVLQAGVDRLASEAYPYGDRIAFPVQPVTDIHFNADNLFEHAERGDRSAVDLLLLIGAFLVLVAGINYVTLGTARSLQRAKEIGVRKALGASRRGLVGQVLLEGTLTGVVAAVLALGVAEVALRGLLPAWFGVALSLGERPWLVPFVLAVGAAVGATAAAFLAAGVVRFNPAETLRGRYVTAAERRLTVRDGLVLVQFVATAALLVGSLVVYRQVAYLYERDRGYDVERVVQVQTPYGVDSDAFRAFLTRVRAEASVVNAGASLYEPLSDYNATALVRIDPATGDTFSTRAQWNRIDYDWPETLGLELAGGRFFDPERARDTLGVILNETAARALGLDPATAAGTELPTGGPAGVVVGVVRDFHFQAPSRPVLPVALFLASEGSSTAVVRLAPGSLRASLARLRAAWNAAGIQAPFEYSFLDQHVEAMLVREARLRRLTTAFALLSILVACLGLVGLVGHQAERRRKEIGIRKALGASVGDVLVLLNRRFLLLVAAAFVLATPVAWWGARRWLEAFPYRVTVAGWEFAAAGALLVVFATATVTLRALRAARTNPALVLRDE